MKLFFTLFLSSAMLATKALAQDITPNTVSTISTDATNQTSVRINGANSPINQAGARNISFEFAGAGKAQIRSYRGGSWDTYLEFLTNPSNNSSGIPTVNMHLDQNGNLGVGTTNPGAVLTVTNHIPVIQLFDLDTNPTDGSSIGKLAFGSTLGEFASIEGIRSGSAYDDVAQIRFSTSYATGAGGDGYKERMRLTPQGNLLINRSTETNAAYKLDVNGNIRANQIVVNTTGADFVFAPYYCLMPLSSLSKYINRNHRLPEIASAKEMQVEGVNVGENQTRLLQKVEELTLYLIEKDKQVQAQQKELNQEKQKNAGQEQRIKLLETKFDLLLKNSH